MNDAGFCTAAVKPLGPLQEYTRDEPVAVLLTVNALPEHTVAGVAVAVTEVGRLFTVTDAVVAVTVHTPDIALSVYTPADKDVEVNEAGLSKAEVKLLGPVHE